MKRFFIIYYVLAFFALTISAIFLFEFLVINPSSLAPLLLALMSVMQFFIFKDSLKTDDPNGANSTAYSSAEIDYEQSRRSIRFHAISKLAILPPLVALAIYLEPIPKIAASFLIYILSFLVVPIIVKICKRKQFMARRK